MQKKEADGQRSGEALSDSSELEKDEVTFYQVVDRFCMRARQERLHMQFHVFADKRDAFPRDPAIALALYRQLLEEGYPGVRLYVELYSDQENDVLEHEDCLLSYGPYPS